MNNLTRVLKMFVVVLAAVSCVAAVGAQKKKSSSSEEFFIISSVNLPKAQILLKWPTEVTLLMQVNDKTRFQDDQGKPLRLADLHSGDTVWVISSAGNAGASVALRVRKGPMTIEELHRLYLDYPVIP